MPSFINGKLYGQPGVGLYDLTPDQIRDCCCSGLVISSVSFETIGVPDCDIVPQGVPSSGPVYQKDTSIGAATALALGYISDSAYITKCRPTELNPDPATNFCQDKIPVFTLKGVEVLLNGYSFVFEVEDCAIPPVDYLMTIVVGIL
jgi:hypothetical protein